MKLYENKFLSLPIKRAFSKEIGDALIIYAISLYLLLEIIHLLNLKLKKIEHNYRKVTAMSDKNISTTEDFHTIISSHQLKFVGDECESFLLLHSIGNCWKSFFSPISWDDTSRLFKKPLSWDAKWWGMQNDVQNDHFGSLVEKSHFAVYPITWQFCGISSPYNFFKIYFYLESSIFN